MPLRTLLALILAVGIAVPAGGRPLPVSGAQEEAEEAPPAITLSPGERFSIEGLWDLEVQRAFRAGAPDRPEYSDVRVAVALRNTSARSLVYGRAALAEGPDPYPQLRLRDAARVVHPIPLTEPHRSSVNGSNLGSLPPGATARWTVGFEVPTIYAGDLTAEAVREDEVVAAWDLEAAPVPLSGWPPPPETAPARMGEPIEWGEDLSVTPTGHATALCGDPTRQHAVLLFGVSFLVENRSPTDAPWPDTKYPEVPAVAIWGDGASAHFTLETATGTAEPLIRHSFETVVIPPHLSPDGVGTAAPPEDRTMVFVVPRDGRFGGTQLPAQAVMLFPPAPEGVPTPRWLQIEGPPSGAIDLSFCEEFAPEIAYEVVP